MEQEDIKKVLDGFPSYVKVYETIRQQSKLFIQNAIEKRLREEGSDTFDNDVEKLKGYNLLSFLYFILDERKNAIKYNERSLDVDDQNINAVACRTFYHLQWKEFFKSSQKCLKLKTLKNGNELGKLSAKAEVAYLFSKLGMDFYSESVKRFEEVFNEAENVPQLHLCSWYFSLAQTIRRQLNTHNIPKPLEPNLSETLLKRFVNVCTEILHTKGENVDRYRAKTFAELGLVLYVNRYSDLGSRYTHKECMDNAHMLRPDDTCVLERRGKYFKLTKKIDDAIRCFERAIEKKESSLSYHHLALCHKIKVTNELTQKSTTFTGHNFDRNFTKSNSTKNLVHSDTSEVQNTQVSRGDVEQTRQIRSPEESLQLKLLKCPKELQYIPPIKITHICKLLDKAVEISHNTNTAALYDKGLILRASKQLADAVDIFKLIFQNDSSSDMQLTNSYEQAAFCLLEMAATDSENKEAYEYDAKLYLKKAMEMSCIMIRKIPNLELCWHSTPTLKMLLSGEAESKGKLRDLAHFHKLLDDHSDVIGFLEKVLNIEEDEEEKLKLQVEIIESNLKIKNYNEAILILNMILCLPNGEKDIEKSLLVEVCIKGGLDAYKRGETELAKRHVKTALRYSSPHVSTYIGNTFDNFFDLFILSSEASEENARNLCKVLTDLGVKTTLNSDEVSPGYPVREEIIDIIDHSQYLVVFIGAEDEKEDLQYFSTYTDVIKKRFKYISEGGRAERDSLYSRYQLITFNCQIMNEQGNISDDFLDWFEGFFLRLAKD